MSNKIEPAVLVAHRRMRPGISAALGDDGNWTNGTGAKYAVNEWDRAWPAAFASPEDKAKRASLYIDLLSEHPWITSSTWRDTVGWLKWNHTTDFLPNPARIIEVAREMSRAEEAKKRSQARLRDIIDPPEPEPVTGPAEYGNVLRMLRGQGGSDLDVPTPVGLRAAIANGTWDRGAALGRAKGRMRADALSALIETHQSLVDPMATNLKGALASARWSAHVTLGTVRFASPSTAQIDDELRRMDTEGTLRGPLTAALSSRLEHQEHTR